MSERSGGRERSEQSGASERVSDASKRANGRASGPVVQSVFLAVIDHSALWEYQRKWEKWKKRRDRGKQGRVRNRGEGVGGERGKEADNEYQKRGEKNGRKGKKEKKKQGIEREMEGKKRDKE